MRAFLNRLKEPSSLAGISVLLALFGVPVAPDSAAAIVQLIGAAAAAGAVLLPEGKSK